MESENTSNNNKNISDEECVLIEENANTTVDESNLNTTIGNDTSKLAPKTPASQNKKSNKNVGDLNKSVTNSCEKVSKEQKMQLKLENAKKRQEEKEKKERERKEKEELRAKQEEERKRKKEEEEKQRLKRLEEKEKQNQERIEKERKRQEQVNLRNEEKRKKEEEKKRLEEEKKRAEEEKQREEEEKRRKADKVKSHFASYFIKIETTANQTDKEELKSLRFMPFQLKENMHLAPICRHIEFSQMNSEQREQFIANLDNIVLNEQNDSNKSDYLKLIKQIRKKYKSTRRGKFLKFNEKTESKIDETNSSDDIKLIENIVPLNNMTKYKVKYLHFDPKQYRRPPYYGTWNKKSKLIRGRNPFFKDEKIIDYEIDSDDEWEDEADGESIADSDKGDMEEDTVNGDDEDDDGFFVPHGHLSDDELDEDERNLDEETKKAREQAKKEQYEMERKKNTKYLIPNCFFMNEYWNVPDKLNLDSVRPELKILNKYQMVPLMTPLPILITNEVPNQDKKSDEIKSKNNNSDNISSPNPTPKSKSNKQSKQNLNNSSTQSPSTTPSTSNNKGSIIKFISKLSNKTCKIEQVGTPSNTLNETSTTQNATTTITNTTTATINVSSKTTDNIITTKNTPTVKLKKGNSSVILKQGSPSTPLNTKSQTNTNTTAEKRACNENSESAVKRLKLDDCQLNETQSKSATKTTASPTILALFKNSTCRKNLRLSSCEIDMREEDSTDNSTKSKDDVNLLSPKKGPIKANSIDENNKQNSVSSKMDVLMDTSDSLNMKNEINNDKENAIITID